MTYLQTRDDTSIKAPLRRQTICQICHKSAAFRFCSILLRIFHICGDIFFWIKKCGLLDFADAVSCHRFFHNYISKGLSLVQTNRQSQKSCIATARGCSGSESMDGMGEAPARSCGNQRFTSPNKSPPPTVLQCTTRPQ